MSAIINASIDLSKIDSSRIFEKDGRKWLSLSISVNDETNYGNNVGISIAQSKEEREAKQPKTYLGNGKVVWNSGTIVNATKEEQEVDTSKDLPF
jgi:beta-xylosidase